MMTKKQRIIAQQEARIHSLEVTLAIKNEEIANLRRNLDSYRERDVYVSKRCPRCNKFYSFYSDGCPHCRRHSKEVKT